MEPSNANRIAQKRCPNGISVFLQKQGLKASLNPANPFSKRKLLADNEDRAHG